MKVDGNRIRNTIKKNIQDGISQQPRQLSLAIIYAGDNPVIKTFTQLKQRFGQEVGAEVRVYTFSDDISQTKLNTKISDISQEDRTDGAVVQLPLPEQIKDGAVLQMIPANKDVDVLSTEAYEQFEAGDSPVLPPVVGAIKEIFDRYDVDFVNSRIAVVGSGRLVGQPIIDWFQLQGGDPRVFTKGDDLSGLKRADIIVAGAGDSHIIRPKHIQKGVVLMDAGTSQSEGGTKGDVHPDCGNRASLYSPVPGGIGPITVAKLFENLYKLSEIHA